MKKMSASNLLILAAICLTSCGKKDEDKNNASSGQVVLEMPSQNSEMNLIAKPSALTSGNYKLSRITTYFKGTQHNITGGFDHSLKTLGKLATGDKVVYSAEWGSLDKSEETFYITNELNVPQRLKIEQGKIEFEDHRYYWNQIRGEKSWGWSASGDESPRGARFDNLFRNGSVVKGKYTSEAKLYGDEEESYGYIVQPDAKSIEFYFQIKHSDRSRNIRITYKM